MHAVPCSRNLGVAAWLAVSLGSAAFAEIQFSQYGGGQQIWISSNSFVSRSLDGGAPNYVLDYYAFGTLSGESYYFPYGPTDGPANQFPWWAQYEVPAALIPAEFNVSGTWYFWARTQMPAGSESDTYADSDYILVNGHPTDLAVAEPTEPDWEAAIAARADGDDLFLNNLAPDAISPNWRWVGASHGPAALRPKTVAILGDKLSFRIYEREAYKRNARVDVIVLANSAEYVPTDGDYTAFCTDATSFDANPVSPASLKKPQGTVELTISGTNVNLLDGVSLIRPVAPTCPTCYYQSDTPAPDTIIPGTIIDSSQSDQIVASFDLTNQPAGLYQVSGSRPGACGPIEPVYDVFELQLPDGDNYVVNGGFEQGTEPWVVEGDAVITSGPLLAGTSAHEGSYFLGMEAEGVVTTGTATQSLGLPNGPGEYDIVFAAWIRLHDVLHNPTHVVMSIIVDENEVATKTIALSGWPNQETLGYDLFTLDWKGMATADITVRFDLLADGTQGWTPRLRGVIAIDDVGVYTASPPCPQPFADVDEDGDVDQEDFGLLQKCFGGDNQGWPAELEYCRCLDRPEGENLPDGDIDLGDLAAFEACARGPEIPPAPDCE
jgi:hypothetical protein